LHGRAGLRNGENGESGGIGLHDCVDRRIAKSCITAGWELERGRIPPPLRFTAELGTQHNSADGRKDFKRTEAPRGGVSEGGNSYRWENGAACLLTGRADEEPEGGRRDMKIVGLRANGETTNGERHARGRRTATTGRTDAQPHGAGRTAERRTRTARGRRAACELRGW